MKRKILLSFALVLVFGISVLAQRTADFTIPFEENIENIVLNPYIGDVIVKEKNAISCLDQESKEILWRLSEEDIASKNILGTVMKSNDILSGDISSLFESSEQIEFILNSPYIRATFDYNDAIIHSMNGEVVFNSAEIGARILKSEFLAEQETFLFLVEKESKIYFFYYSLKAKKVLWEKELDSVVSFMKALGDIFKKDAGGEDQILILGDDIYSSVNGFIYKINQFTGDISWKTDYKVQNFYFSQTGEKMIVVLDTGGIFSMKQNLNILDVKTGDKLWKNDITTKYISYIEDWKDRIMVAHQSGFNFYSYDTGKKMWKKDAKGKNIKRVIPVDENYLYIADNEMNLIDSDGKNKWKKFVEIADKKDDEVYYLGKVDNNRVLYLTDTYGNMVDYTTGKKIWRRNIKFNKNRPVAYAYDETQNIFLVYNNKKIYKFDPNVKDAPEAIGDKIKVNNDKNIQNIELFDWGICIIGQNDVVGVGFDGEVLYHNTYKEPGETGRRLLKSSSIIGGNFYGSMSAINSTLANITISYRDETGNLISQTKLYDDKTTDKMLAKSEMQGSTADAIGLLKNKVSHRYNALKTNADYAFVFARGENGESTQLVKVRKSDGKEIDKIAIDNNRPIYEIDPITNAIFYAYKNEIRIFTEK